MGIWQKAVGKKAKSYIVDRMRAEGNFYKKAGSYLKSGGAGLSKALRRGPNGTTLPWMEKGQVHPTIQRRLIPAGIAIGLGSAAYGAAQAKANGPDEPGMVSTNGNLEVVTPGMLNASGAMVFSMHNRGKS